MLVKVSDIFDVKYGNGLALSDLSSNIDGINFISRTEKNNGKVGNVSIINEIPNPEHTISVAVGGSVMSSFYQENKYYTGYHILILSPKIELTKNEMLYYCMCLKANKYKYNYGRQANKTLKDLMIPSYDSIPSYVNTINSDVLNKEPKLKDKIELKANNWKYFKLTDLFEIKKSIPEHKIDSKKGNIRYVTRTMINNGVEDYIDSNKFNLKECFIIGGESAGCFWQNENFATGNNITLLRPLFNFNILIITFIKVIMDIDKYKYSYGRARSLNRIIKEKIKLPATPDGNPDWEFMENYIKSLPYSSNLESINNEK